MTTHPIRLDRLQAGIRTWASTILTGAAVLWAPSEYPRPALGPLVVTARLIAGPDPSPQGGEWTQSVELPTLVRITITSAGEGERVLLRVAGRRWELVIGAGQTITTVRDALLAELIADPMVSALFVATSSNAIDIEADSPGDIWGLQVQGSATSTIIGTFAGLAQVSEVVSMIQLQALSISRYPQSGASAALARLQSTWRLPIAREIFDAHGISVLGGPSGVINLDALAGAKWASKAAISLRFAQLSIAVGSSDFVENVAFELTEVIS